MKELAIAMGVFFLAEAVIFIGVVIYHIFSEEE